MAQIPREFIRGLIDRANLADIIGAHVKLERKAGRWFGLCPFHNEKTPSFAVNSEKGFYHCFGCGAHGDALAFMVHLNGGDFMSGLEALAGELGETLPKRGAPSGPDTAPVLKAAMEHWRNNLRRSPEAVEYLKGRGVSGEMAKQYALGFSSKEWDGLLKSLSSFDKELLIAAGLVRKKENFYDYFRQRLMFPILEANNRVCGFGARTLGSDEPKYLNSPETAQFSKRRLLYGLPQAIDAARQKKRLVVCEGYLDVVLLAENGFGEAVATMGTAATSEQMKKAARIAPHIVFAYDSDAAGQKGALRALEGILPALKDGISAAFITLPEGDDPDSYVRKNGAAAFEDKINEATPLAAHLAEMLWQNAEAADDDGRRTTVMREGERLTRLLNPQDAPYWRQLLTERLAERTGMAAGALQKAVAKRPVKKPRAGGNYQMRPESKLFMLLCCLSAAPEFINKFEEEDGNIPLPGNEIDTAIVAGALSKLRWNMDDKPPNVAEVLEEDYPALARQVQKSAARRLLASPDIDIAVEFNSLIERLRAEHKRAANKRDWLNKLAQQTS